MPPFKRECHIFRRKPKLTLPFSHISRILITVFFSIKHYLRPFHVVNVSGLYRPLSYKFIIIFIFFLQWLISEVATRTPRINHVLVKTKKKRILDKNFAESIDSNSGGNNTTTTAAAAAAAAAGVVLAALCIHYTIKFKKKKTNCFLNIAGEPKLKIQFSTQK